MAQKSYQRFSLLQRLEHWVMVASFTVLALTGLPQKYPYADISQTMLAWGGGIESVRVIHRYAAIILMIGTIYHGGVISYKLFVRRVPWTMLPGWQDAKDLFGTLAFNLGLRAERPKLPRYNFEEKMEYWSLIWGTVLMIMTGFMLWNPIATAKFLPGSFIPAAKAAHGGEALLAVLAIIVWHMYTVHLKRFNPSMFTGKLSRKAMEHDHALELEAIEAGTVPTTPPKSVIARRTWVFLPIAVVIAATLSAGLYWFVTFEDTAVVTIEALRLPEDKAYQPIDVVENNQPHASLAEYSGPESCVTAGCHAENHLSDVEQSDHNRAVAEKGWQPILAKISTAEDAAVSSDCLICHATDYHPENLLASAKTVGPAGGETCLRCHQLHPSKDVHTDVGLGCTSCHTSTGHTIKPTVNCTDCHVERPHTDVALNGHAKLDCRACHITGNIVQLTFDTTNAIKDKNTGWFAPQVHRIPANAATFAWKNGTVFSDIDDAGALIVPVISGTVSASQPFNGVEFSIAGIAEGSPAKIPVQITASHGIQKDVARTCEDCHGPESEFDFLALGYSPERAEQLSLSISLADAR